MGVLREHKWTLHQDLALIALGQFDLVPCHDLAHGSLSRHQHRQSNTC
jgi:hypothetical protein